MRVLEGKSVFSGIAIGKISILQKADTSVKRTKVENPEAEITRVQEAKEKAVEQLQKLYDKALREVGESGAAIFEVGRLCEEKMPGNKLNMQVQYYDKWNVSYR